jgi:hypothetical protein
VIRDWIRAGCTACLIVGLCCALVLLAEGRHLFAAGAAAVAFWAGTHSDLAPHLRGVRAVVWLLTLSIWELATAVLGVRPSLPPAVREFGHAIAEEYRAGRNRWTNFEPVDDAREVDL